MTPAETDLIRQQFLALGACAENAERRADATYAKALKLKYERDILRSLSSRVVTTLSEVPTGAPERAASSQKRRVRP